MDVHRLEFSLANIVLETWNQLDYDSTAIIKGICHSDTIVSLTVVKDKCFTSLILEASEDGRVCSISNTDVKCSFQPLSIPPNSTIDDSLMLQLLTPDTSNTVYIVEEHQVIDVATKSNLVAAAEVNNEQSEDRDSEIPNESQVEEFVTDLSKLNPVDNFIVQQLPIPSTNDEELGCKQDINHIELTQGTEYNENLQTEQTCELLNGETVESDMLKLEDTVFRCYICDYSCTSLDILQEHFLESHQVKANFSNPVMADMDKRRNRKKKGTTKSEPGKKRPRFTESDCAEKADNSQTSKSEESLDEQQLQLAEEITRLESDLSGVCTVCSEVFPQMYILIHHLREVHPEDELALIQLQELRQSFGDEPALKCCICNKTFPGYSVIVHIHKQHKYHPLQSQYISKLEEQCRRFCSAANCSSTVIEEMLQCNICGLMVINSLLEDHQSNDCLHQMPTSERICSICNFKTTDLATFQSHMQEMHDDQRYLCHICNKSFSNRNYLTTHLRYRHLISVSGKPIPVHVCLYCKKKCPTKDHLKNHLVVHTNEKAFQCHICSKRFNRAAIVQNHIKIVHLGKYPYNCERCGHGVAKKAYLDAHRCRKSLIKRHLKKLQRTAELVQDQC